MVAFEWVLFVSLALYTAYGLAKRLFRPSFIDVAAATILFWLWLLIASLLLPGMVGLFTPWVTGATLLILCLGIILLMTRHWPRSAHQDRTLHFSIEAAPLQYALAVLLSVILCVQLVRNVILLFDEWQTGTFIDVVRFEVPTVVNFIHSNSLWDFRMFFAYYGYNYHLLFAIGMWSTSNYALLPIIHFVPWTGVILYTVLIGLRAARSFSSGSRLVLGLLFANGLLLARIMWELLNVGKNDLFVALMLLAAIYYFLRYWELPEEDKEPNLLLVGMTLGVGLGTKLTVTYWVAAIGLVHGLLLIWKHSWRVWRWHRTMIRQFVLMLGPALLFAGPWLIRAWLGYRYTEFDIAFQRRALDTALINVLDSPFLRTYAVLWMPFLILTLIGLSFLLIPSPHRVRAPLVLSGWMLILVSSWAVMFDRSVVLNGSLSSGLFPARLILAMVLACGVAAATLFYPDLMPRSVAPLAVWTFLGGLILIITPLSGWSDLGPDYVALGYRPQPILSILAVPMLIVFSAYIVRDWFMRSQRWPVMQPVDISLPSYWQDALIFGCLLLILGAAVFRATTYRGLETLPKYMPSQDTELYRWTIRHLHHERILTTNDVMPYLLYGDDLSNEVYFYSGDLPGSGTIKTQDISYLVVRKAVLPQGMYSGCPKVFEDNHYKVIEVASCDPG